MINEDLDARWNQIPVKDESYFMDNAPEKIECARSDQMLASSLIREFADLIKFRSPQPLEFLGLEFFNRKDASRFRDRLQAERKKVGSDKNSS